MVSDGREEGGGNRTFAEERGARRGGAGRGGAGRGGANSDLLELCIMRTFSYLSEFCRNRAPHSHIPASGTSVTSGGVGFISSLNKKKMYRKKSTVLIILYFPRYYYLFQKVELKKLNSKN